MTARSPVDHNQGMDAQQTDAPRARLSIEGVRERVTARVRSRRDGGMVVEQELPFLSVGRAVRGEDGRAAKIARIGLAMERGVPRIVLELDYDAEVPSGRSPRPPAVRTARERDATIGYDERPRAVRLEELREGPPRPVVARNVSRLLHTVPPALLPLAIARQNRVTWLDRVGVWLAALVAMFMPRPA